MHFIKYQKLIFFKDFLYAKYQKAIPFREDNKGVCCTLKYVQVNNFQKVTFVDHIVEKFDSFFLSTQQ